MNRTVDTLHCYVVEPGKDLTAIEGKDKGILLRGIFGTSVHNKSGEADELVKVLVECEIAIVNQLRHPTDKEMRQSIRHAVTPLFAAVIS